MKRREIFEIQQDSLNILKNIQKKLKEKRQKIIEKKPQKEILTETPVVQGPQFQYIPEKIQEYILKHEWKNRFKIKHNFVISGKTINLDLYIYTDNNTEPSIEILTFFSFLLENIDNLKEEHYELYYYATPFLKEFPEIKGELIDEIHANSGFTVKTSPVPIYIFREEEGRRVCIHEILHAFGYDGVEPITWKAPVQGEECLNLLEKINGEHLCNGEDGVRIYEAFTETQATILNILIQGVSSLSELKKMLKQEFLHVIQQVNNIEQHYDIIAKNDYGKYKQGVSKTISYFLFRKYLLKNINRFIKNSLLKPASKDYVKIIEEEIKKQGVEIKIKRKTIKRKVNYFKRRTLKMNYSV